MQNEATAHTETATAAGDAARAAASRAVPVPAALSGAAFVFPGLLAVVLLIIGRVVAPVVVRTRTQIMRGQAAH